MSPLNSFDFGTIKPVLGLCFWLTISVCVEALPLCSTSLIASRTSSAPGSSGFQLLSVSLTSPCVIASNQTFEISLPSLFQSAMNTTTASLYSVDITLGITMQDPTSCVIVAGWSNQRDTELLFYSDALRASQVNFSVSIANVSGRGRLIFAGYLPSSDAPTTSLTSRNAPTVIGTSLRIRDVTLDMEWFGSNLSASHINSIWGSYPLSLASRSFRNCVNASVAASSALCISTNLSFWLQVGPNVTVSNLHTQNESDSAASGVFQAVLTAAAFHFDDVSSSGSLKISRGFSSGTRSVHSSTSISSLSIGIPRLVTATTISIESGRINAANFQVLNATFVVFIDDDPVALETTDQSVLQVASLLIQTPAPSIFVGFGCSLIIDGCTMIARRDSGGSLDDDTVRTLPPQVTALAFSSAGPTSVQLYRLASFTLSYCNFIAVANESVVGTRFGTISVTRSVVMSVEQNSWNVTAICGNASALSVGFMGMFPSLVAFHSNTALISTIANDFMASWVQITTGYIKAGNQLLFYDNHVTIEANTTYVFPPTRVNLTESNEDDGPVAIIPIQPVAIQMGLSPRFYVGSGGSLVFMSNVINFSAALMPLFMDGDSSDYIMDLDVGAMIKVVSLVLYAGSDNAVVFKRSLLRFNFIGGQYSAEFVFGCLQVNNIRPVYRYSDVMSANLPTYLTTTECDCLTANSAIGHATNSSGTFPNCIYQCRKPSSCPIEKFRLQCAQPTYDTISATLTTKTPRLLATATTYTAGLTPSWNRTLSRHTRSQSLKNTPTAINTFSTSLMATATVQLTNTLTLHHTKSATRTNPNRTVSRSVNQTRSVTLVRSVGNSLSISRQRHDHSATQLGSNTHALTPTRSRTLRATTSANVAEWRTLSVAVTVSFTYSQTRSAPKTPSSRQSRSRTVWVSATLVGTHHTLILTKSMTVSMSVDASAVAMSRTRTRKYSRTASARGPGATYKFLTQSKALGFLTLALTAIATTLTNNPTVFHTQFIAILGQVYASSDNAYQRTLPMAYIISPFWDYGPVKVSVANVVIIAGFAIIHAVVVRLDLAHSLVGTVSSEEEGASTVSQPMSELAPKESKTSKDEIQLPLPASWAAHHFPQWSLIVAFIFYQGTVSAAFHIFYHESGATFILGTLCLVLATVVPSGYYWVMHRFLANRMPQYRELRLKPVTLWTRALPGGMWVYAEDTSLIDGGSQPPSAPQNIRSLICFGALYQSFTPSTIRFGSYPFFVVLFVNAAASVSASNSSQRDAQFGVLGFIFAVAALCVLIALPHRSGVANAVYGVSFLLLMALCVCLANESTDASAADGVPVLIIVTEVLLWCHGIFEIAVWYSEMYGAASALTKQHAESIETPPVELTAEPVELPRRHFMAKERSYMELDVPIETVSKAPALPELKVAKFFSPTLPPLDSPPSLPRVIVEPSNGPLPIVVNPPKPSPTPPPPPPPADDDDGFLSSFAPSVDPVSAASASPFSLPSAPSLLGRGAPLAPASKVATSLRPTTISKKPTVAKKRRSKSKAESSSSDSSFFSSDESDDSDL